MIDYLEVQEGKYNTAQAEAINCLAQMQMGRGRRSNPTRFKKYGKDQSDTGFQNMKSNPYGDTVLFAISRGRKNTSDGNSAQNQTHG